MNKIEIRDIRPSFEFGLNAIRGFIDDKKGYRPRMLEVGCGVRSVIGSHLRESNHSIILHGIDIDDYSLANKEVDEVFIAGVENMPFDDGSYDIVVAQYMLEHVHEYQIALKEMARVLKKEGILILTFPNPSSPEAIVTRFTPLWFHKLFRRVVQKIKDADKHTFTTTFDFRSIKNVVKVLMSNGCSNIEVSYFAETYYRFKYWRFLGNLAVLYTKMLSLFRLNIFKSHVVLIAYKK